MSAPSRISSWIATLRGVSGGVHVVGLLAFAAATDGYASVSCGGQFAPWQEIALSIFRPSISIVYALPMGPDPILEFLLHLMYVVSPIGANWADITLVVWTNHRIITLGLAAFEWIALAIPRHAPDTRAPLDHPPATQ